jgi:hypothetical protein
MGSGFRSGAEGVRVDVLVTDGRNPIAGLTAANFELRDSGVVQTIDSVFVEDVPLSVMLALDTSRSADGAALGHLKDAAYAVVRMLGPADLAALMTFSGAVRLRRAASSEKILCFIDELVIGSHASWLIRGSTASRDASK